MPCLRIKLPDNKGEITHVLAGQRITIGRRPENTIQIIDRTVSGHHAELIATNGHYRLHDLGSTNLTCVEGAPVTDFHLHKACKVSFGTIECEFSTDAPTASNDTAEMVPTRAELEYLRRENLDLQSKISSLQKQVDILSSARLMTKSTTQLVPAPEAHRRTVQERDDFRRENSNLKCQLENLQEELAARTRQGDAMRLAWETVKAELAEVQAKLASRADSAAVASVLPERAAGSEKSMGADAAPIFRSSAAPATTAAEAPQPPPTAPEMSVEDAPIFARTGAVAEKRSNSDTQPIKPPAPAKSAMDHRAMATVLMKAPALLKSVISTIERLSTQSAAPDARASLVRDFTALSACLAPVAGHPVERIITAIEALLSANQEGPLESTTLRTINQAVTLVSSLLEPRHLKRAQELATPRALLVDDDLDLLAAVAEALGLAEIETSSAGDAEDALQKLTHQTFDLVLLDIGLPTENGIDVCDRLREMPQHQQTPVLFLTAENTVENRAQSSLSGGNDFISKPFNASELAVKAATWAYRRQFGLLT